MGGCAPYCNNSAAKKYMMKRFSRNPERQAIWIKNVDREDLGINKQFIFFAKLICLNFLQ